MANVSDFLKKLMEARYGRDVRAAIHDSIDAMNTESTQAYSASIDAKDSAQKSATAASGSAANAKNYSDSAKKYAESASAAIEAAYDTQSTESKVITNTIEAPMMVTKFTKNLLNPTLGTTTVNGVTCTKNSDGTYTLNGTATAFTYFSLLATVENGFSGMKYVGAPDGSGWDSYFLWGMYRDKDKEEVKNITSYKYSNGVVVEDCETYPYLDLRIAIREGQSLNNLIFKPMITTDLDATYDDYVPYSEYRIKTCGKNLLPISSVGSQTINGITFTNNGDGTWTLNGTATGGATLYISPFGSGLIQNLKDKEFVVVGTEGTNKDTEAFVQLTLSKNGTEKEWFRDYRTIRKIGDEDNARFEITVRKGYTCNAMLVKPMITDITSATYDDFEPYKESSVNVTSMSQAPLLGLKTFSEITHVFSNGNVTAAYALTETGKYVMECRNEIEELKKLIIAS